MSDFIDGLEQDLVAAARRLHAERPIAARRWWRPPLRGLLIAAALTVSTAGTAAAGTLLALRGSPIPVPREVPREQMPAAGSSLISEVRVRDPERPAPPWTVRVATSRTGLLCSTVGQIVDGEFGLVGLDGRFRALPEAASDSCGVRRDGAASLIGARVFDGRRREDVRTVVSGVADDTLRRVVVETGLRRITVPIAAGGVFAAALRGYPEDLGIRVTLSFASGRREIHDFGRSPFVVPDPEGGRAWRTQIGMFGGVGQKRPICTTFMPARQVLNPPVSPAACGDLGPGPRWRGWYFAVRRLTPGAKGQPFVPGGGRGWGGHPARTAVWGAVGEDVRGVAIRRGNGIFRAVPIAPSRAFLAVFGPDVDPRSLMVRLRLANGSVVVRHGSDHLVDSPIPAQRPEAARSKRSGGSR